MKLYAYRTLGGGWTACATWGRTMLWADGPTWAAATRAAMLRTYSAERMDRP